MSQTVNDIEKAIRVLIEQGEKIADATGEHFFAGNEEYIPVNSKYFDDYKWIRENHCLSDTEGFWYSSSMDAC